MRIAISAGEASGDQQGAALLAELARMTSDIQAYAVGGGALRRAGAEIIVESGGAGAIGLFEAAKLIPRGLAALAKLKRELTRRRPDVLVLIDCGAFNTRVAAFAKQRTVPTLYYFPPGSWRRGPKPPAAERWLGDVIVTPFPWNAEDLRAAGHNAFFFGHPLLDLIDSRRDRGDLRSELGLADNDLVIGLLPGSRAAEIAHLWPAMVLAAARMRQEEGHCRFLVPLSANLPASAAQRVRAWRGEFRRASDDLQIHVLDGRARDVMRASDLIVTASGTATLEAAILGCPMIIAYRAGRLTYLQYLIVRKTIPYIGMPNTIAGREICPELVQGEASAQRIATLALVLVRDPGRRAAMRWDLDGVREALGPAGAIGRTAEKVLELANR